MPPTDVPYKIFVSHIHEEAALAAVIKASLEDAFAGRIEAFVSSDPGSNPGGENWLDKIARELRDPQTRMLISLVSPAALGAPWIAIELGAAWILGLSVFPICHSGQSFDNLPRPMQDFGGADLERDDNTAKRLIGAVERATAVRTPGRWPVDAFLSEMRGALGHPVAGPSQIHGVGFVTRAQATVPSDELPDEQVKILQLLAVAKNTGRGDASSLSG